MGEDRASQRDVATALGGVPVVMKLITKPTQKYRLPEPKMYESRRVSRLHVPQFDEVIARVPKNPPPPAVVAQCRRAFKAGVPARRVVAAIRAVLDEHKAIASRSKKRGHARGGGQSSKAKGRTAVQLTREYLLRTFDLDEDDILVKATSMGGCDLHLSPHAQSWFPFAIEVKNQEKMNVWAAFAQAEANGKKKGHPPVLFFKRARTPLYVAFAASDLLDHLKETYIKAGR